MSGQDQCGERVAHLQIWTREEYLHALSFLPGFPTLFSFFYTAARYSQRKLGAVRLIFDTFRIL